MRGRRSRTGVLRAPRPYRSWFTNPVAYGTDITPEMFVEPADEPSVVSIKEESSEHVRRITDLKNITGDRYILFNGVEDLTLEAVMLGAPGQGMSLFHRRGSFLAGIRP